jgi:hypothetical protein
MLTVPLIYFYANVSVFSDMKTLSGMSLFGSGLSGLGLRDLHQDNPLIKKIKVQTLP